MTTAKEIDWASLEDAYGPATEVPELLAKVRKAKHEMKFSLALGELCSHVLHQGTIYSASPAAVRELIAMAASEKDKRKRPAFYTLFNEFAEAARVAHANGKFIPCHSGGDPVHADLIREELRRAEAACIPDLKDSDAAIRAGAAGLLLAFEDASATAIELVRAAFLSESEAATRLLIFDGLIRVRAQISDWPKLLEVALARETEPANRFPILHSQVEARQPAPSDSIWLEFVQAFADANAEQMAGSVDERFFQAIAEFGADDQCSLLLEVVCRATQSWLLCVLLSHLLGAAFGDRRTNWGGLSSSLVPEDGSRPRQPNLVRVALRSVGLLLLMKLAPPVFRWRLRRMAAAQKINAGGIWKIEFWGVKGTPPNIPARLTPLQVRVLTSLVEKPEIWAFQTNLWEVFGLPASADGMKLFAERRSRTL